MCLLFYSQEFAASCLILALLPSDTSRLTEELIFSKLVFLFRSSNLR